MRRALSVFASLVVVAAFAVAPSVAQQKGQGGKGGQRILNVYNWSDYVDPAVLEEFTKSTGIKMRYDTFDTNEALEAKLLAGRSGYDVVAPTGYFLQRQIKAKIFQPLDKGKLPNLVNLWPEVSKRLAQYDPGNVFAVNYMWGTTGIGYNVGKARELLGPNAKIDSWDIVFKPENLAKFKDCGIHMLDSADDILPAALHYLGLNPNSTREPELQKAADLVMTIRPLVRKFHSSEYLNALATGEICFAVGFSGDVKQAQKRAAEAKNNVRDRLCDPERGRPALVRQSRDPARCEKRGGGARVHQLPADARDRRPQLEFHLLCQRQSREPEIHRQGGARRPDHLSGRGDDEEALHRQRPRRGDDAPAQPHMDAREDGKIDGHTSSFSRGIASSELCQFPSRDVREAERRKALWVHRHPF